MPFVEIDTCWAFIGYVNMLQYHVRSEAEVVRGPPWNDWRHVRQSDVRLDEGQITALLRVALQSRGRGRGYGWPATQWGMGLEHWDPGVAEVA